MNKEEWFEVKDLEGFVNSTRALVYNNFGSWQSKEEEDIVNGMVDKPSNKEEFDQLLSQEESLVIIRPLLKKQKNKITKKIRYIVSDSTFYNILEQLNDRLVSNIISSLVKKGLVESAYDSEIDDWVFWVNKNNEQPNTD